MLWNIKRWMVDCLLRGMVWPKLLAVAVNSMPLAKTAEGGEDTEQVTVQVWKRYRDNCFT